MAVIGDDELGITREEIDTITAQFFPRSCKLTLVELAFDFDPAIGVDEEFVLQHAVFGKSRHRPDRGGPEQVRYGSRLSTKLVRCYSKKKLQRYRVELEIHQSLLRKLRVRDRRDFPLLAKCLLPTHFVFVGIRWRALERYVIKRFGSKGEAILREAQRRSEQSLRRATRFLSRKGVRNAHRFLRPLRLNQDINLA